MIDLTSLPLDLLPYLFESLAYRRQDLYRICLVSKEWNEIATPMLYSWIRMFGKDLEKIQTLFKELSSSPKLCALVRKLEIRVYLISMKVATRLEIEAMAVQVLDQCVNLRELIWTRKGALTDRVLESITRFQRLKSLEINGHTNLSPGSWSAERLLDLQPRLTSLSIILPDGKVAKILPNLLSLQSSTLQNLTILCRESPYINDSIVYQFIPAFATSCLTSLSLAGCSRLSFAPLLEFFKILPQLSHLALESNGISPNSYSLFAPYLTNLISIKLTHPGPKHLILSQFYPSLTELIRKTTKLESFTLYHSGSTGEISEWPNIEETFVEILVEVVGKRLRKFECSGVIISISTVEKLIAGAKGLKELVIHLDDELVMDQLNIAISQLSLLRTLHIMYQRTDIDFESITSLAQNASTTLRQIGIRNRVWSIKRTYPTFIDASTTIIENDILDSNGETGLELIETAEAFGAFRRAAYGAESSDQLAD